MPYVIEGVKFGALTGAISFSEGYCILIGNKKAGFAKSFTDTTTNETAEIIDRTRFMGRWLVKSGSVSSIMAAWRVKP